MNIAVLVSGGGTNLQALIDAQESGRISNGNIAVVISSKDGVYALQRAAEHRIPSRVIARKQFSSAEEFDRALLGCLKEYNVGLVVLAGFLSILGDTVTAAYRNRIINVHPSLIPSFCGNGYYGLKVHEAALKYGVKISGATVHFVNEVTDGGAIILQQAVEVFPDDTPETLQLRIMQQAEWKLLPQAVSLFCEGRLTLKDGKVRITQNS